MHCKERRRSRLKNMSAYVIGNADQYPGSALGSIRILEAFAVIRNSAKPGLNLILSVDIDKV